MNKEQLHEQVERTHRYHRPEYQETMDRMGEIRDACKNLGHLLVDVCPISRELSLALTSLDDVNMKAIAALARFEPEPEDPSPNVTSHPLPGDPGYESPGSHFDRQVGHYKEGDPIPDPGRTHDSGQKS